MSKDFFRKICTSYFFVRVWKGLLRVLLWEGVGDRTELQYIDPQRCVSLVLQGCSTGGPGAQLSAGWWLSLLNLITNFSGPQLTDFLSSLSYIIVQSPTQSPTQSLEWHVWSLSSGNNCHTVQRSLSSGASVYECIMGFYLVPFYQPNPPTRFLLLTGHWNVSLPSGASLWNGMFGRVEDQYTTLWLINYWKLFNAKPSLYIYIKLL